VNAALKARRGGEMTKTRKIVLLTIVLVSLDGLLTHGQSQSQVARVETPLRPEERDRLFVIGKRLFVERCAKCHDVRRGTEDHKSVAHSAMELRKGN